MTAIRAVGFDLGETLFFYRGTPMNWAGRYPEALAAVAAAVSFRLSADHSAAAEKILLQHNTRVVPRTDEVSAEQIFSLVLDRWGINISDNLTAAVTAFFSIFQQGLCPYEDASPALAQLRKAGLPIGLLTDVPYGMPVSFVKSDLKSAGLATSYDALVTSVEVGHRKPHLAGFLALSEKLRVLPHELLYVGNEQKDVSGAKAAGACSVLIDRDNASPSYGQDYTIHSLRELPDVLTKLT